MDPLTKAPLGPERTHAERSVARAAQEHGSHQGKEHEARDAGQVVHENGFSGQQCLEMFAVAGKSR